MSEPGYKNTFIFRHTQLMKKSDIQVHMLFTLILFMLVVSSRHAVYWKGICALLGFYAIL